ncbi:MAG TPA: hypothetical protein VGP24_03165, partial [Glaciihabitans sp.]|nr:hypothetical protein [Glaciihabitans sp.]
IGQAFGRGDNHGFTAKVNAPAGQQNVCAYAINVGNGSNKLIGCKTVTVTSGTPTGHVDTVRSGTGSITVSGWALDRDTKDSVSVHIYIDKAGTAFTANKSRPDIAKANSGFGDRHGFQEILSATAGKHDVCVYAINKAGSGGNPLLGCKTVTVN